ncbi:MAG TPA: histidine kinase dimerization/phosphoacceptor domain -containing protein [Bacteriovoracaceae bacterium]|nr:histidine kinase dimerization/phosphoacceptor domain -containing protein [Bacteriovoracaceae bacterium]
MQQIILDTVPICIIMIVNKKQVWANKKMEEIFQYQKEDFKNQTTRFLYPSQEAYEKFHDESYPPMAAGHTFESIQELVRRDGTHIFVRFYGKAVAPPDMEQGTIWILEDITERKQSEEQIKKSLHEKEILLKEIHHRVKNNMDIISSLLSLQASTSQNKQLQEMLIDGQHRIKAMAMVHEKLYRANNTAEIDFSDYVETLVSDLILSYNKMGDKFTVSLKLSKITLDIDTAIPCGLIIGELVINVLKYAFVGQTCGGMEVSLDSTDENCQLKVKDNGVGFFKNFDYSNAKTLGLQLVEELTEQLKGKLTIQSMPDIEIGTEINLVFPLKAERGQLYESK